MGKVTYDRDDAATAKADGMIQFTLDVQGHPAKQGRMTCQGFARPERHAEMMAEFAALMKKYGSKPPSRAGKRSR